MSESIGNDFRFLCPKCKRGNQLSIEIKVWATLVPDGSDIEGQDHEWDSDNRASCKECKWQGKVSDFVELPEGEGEIVVCQDCETEWYENQTDPVKDAHERFITGDTFTEHQCPSCGALCFPL
jgi:RecJ-like exonuclease